jgi:hypothetical protein
VHWPRNEVESRRASHAECLTRRWRIFFAGFFRALKRVCSGAPARWSYSVNLCSGRVDTSSCCEISMEASADRIGKVGGTSS